MDVGHKLGDLVLVPDLPTTPYVYLDMSLIPFPLGFIFPICKMEVGLVQKL